MSATQAISSAAPAANPRQTLYAIIASVLGFGYLAGTAALFAKVCIVLFLILALLSFLKKA